MKATIKLGLILILYSSAWAFAKDKKKDEHLIIPANAEYELKNGIDLLKEHKLKKANKAFDKAIEEFDLFYQAFAYKAIIASEEKDFSRSAELFEQSIQVFEKYKDFIITKRKQYINNVKANELNMRMQKVGALTSNNPTSDKDSKDLMAHRLQELENELHNDQKMQLDAFFRFKYGNTLMALKKYDQAKKQYLAAVESDPEYNETYANLSLVYFLEQDYKNALESFNKGKELGTAFHPQFEQTLKTQMAKVK